MRQFAGFIEFCPFQEIMDQSKSESLEKVNHDITLMCSEKLFKKPLYVKALCDQL